MRLSRNTHSLLGSGFSCLVLLSPHARPALAQTTNHKLLEELAAVHPHSVPGPVTSTRTERPCSWPSPA